MGVVFIWSAEDLTNLCQGQVFGSGAFEQMRSNLNVFKAFWPELEIVPKETDVFFDVEIGNVVSCSFRERFFGLWEGKPCEVKGANFK